MPRIIDDETYNAAIEKKRLNREISGKFHSKRYYLLNGLITCGECGRAFSGNTSFAGRNKTEYPTYRCGGYRGTECHNKDVNMHYINDYVLTLLEDIIFNSDRYDDILSALNCKLKKVNNRKKNSVIEIQNKITNNDAKIKKLTDLLVESDNSQAIVDKIKILEQEKTVLIRKLDEVENNKDKPFDNDDIDEVKNKFKAYMLKRDSLICRKLIRTFVEKIVVYRDKIEVIIKTHK